EQYKSSSISCAEQDCSAMFSFVTSNNDCSFALRFINFNSVLVLLAQWYSDMKMPSPAASTVMTSAKSSTSFRLQGSCRTAVCKASASGKNTRPEQCRTVV